ncbi:MAG: HAD-IIB family hydrolase [Candidatus Cloacimonas sp.]|nr:Cof-type HAD-IIB family hydrolase [Candidatus Cloacimonadota bacterium]
MMRQNKKIVFTDLDGTLLNNESILSAKNRETLNRLGEQGVIRAIATGRSLFSAKRVLSLDFPIDYMVFSTGAGIIDWKTQQILYKRNLNESEVNECAEYFLQRKLNFMLHRAVPDTHYFYYHKGEGVPEDFNLRMEIYHGYWAEFNPVEHTAIQATQFLSMYPKDEFEAAYERFTNEKPYLSIIKTSSPLAKNTLWLEIFAEGVNKGVGANKLIDLLNLQDADAMVIGNDYNDKDMLKAFENSYVVANAPKDLRKEHKKVASNYEDGFSEAVEDWLR